MARAQPPGWSIVLVEDETMIRMMVAEMVQDLGHRVSGEASELEQALRMVETVDFDLALLDVNLNGTIVSPLLDLLERMGRPFVFLTGYGRAALPQRHQNRPTLQKPFLQDALARVISDVMEEAAGAPQVPDAGQISA